VKRLGAVIAAVGLIGIVAGVAAQQTGVKRTVLQQADISAPGREAVTAIAEIAPAGSVGRHTHFGEEIGYVMEGTIVLMQDGKPPATLEAGKTFIIPAGTVHDATNKGTAAARVLATYIVEKGKPLATPAPAK
jgi:quercetin dioxygenase-like cupin family protein